MLPAILPNRILDGIELNSGVFVLYRGSMMMFEKLRQPVIMTALILVVGWNVRVVAAAEAVVHKNCSSCHTTDNKLKIADVSELCISCHPNHTSDHKIGVVVKMIPVGLPLDKEHKMTCITCHEPHGNGVGIKMLRMKGESLCQSCHDK